MRFHIHRDPNYMVIGANVYYLCRCGAKRVRRAYSSLLGPTQPGWPALVDSHGWPVDDTGWKKVETVYGHGRDREIGKPIG